MSQAAPPASNTQPKRYYGKYRGLVINNLDPMLQGRIMAQVPDVLGEIPSSWAQIGRASCRERVLMPV